MLKFYFPEAKGQLNYVGYNHAVSLLDKVLGDRICSKKGDPTNARLYCNLPWHNKPKELKRGQPLVLYTMFETTKVPDSWVDYLNKNVQALLVPSQWNHHVFRSSGVRIPIFVISLGYDPNEYPLVPKTEFRDLYVFMWQGVCQDRGGRKGYDIVVDAYTELRDEGLLGEDSRLIVKTKPQHVEDIKLHLDADHGLIFQHSVKGLDEIHELYSMVDCCINPTHGEGFGFIPLEQMAMGKPVIAPNWSMPYLIDGCYIPVRYDLNKSEIGWTHKSISFSWNGFAVNTGGLAHDIRLLPKHSIQYRSCLDERIEIPGIPSKGGSRKSPGRKLINRAFNIAASLQRKSGFVFDRRRVRKQFVFEDTGLDAWVNKEDLKKKMMWCYTHREESVTIGRRAWSYVSRYWTIERIRKEYLEIEDELETIIKRAKS